MGTPATSAGQIHNVLGNVTFFLFPLAALLLFRALGRMGSRLAPGDRSGAGSIDSRGAGRERDRGARLAQRAYLALSAVWQLLAALAVLRNRRFQEAVEPALDPPI
jgi:hypothetical protein